MNANQKGKGKRTSKNVVAAARPGSSHRGTYLAAAAVILIAVVVIGGIFYQHSRTTAANDGYGSAKTAAVTVSDGVVRVGAPNAPVTLNAYEDFLCPICGQFEATYGQQIAQELDQGKIAIKYHMLDFLNQSSASKDYSSRAAGAALCVASDGTGSVFPKFHSALFATGTQPQEGSKSDLSNDALAKVAADAGATSSAQQCISSGAKVADAKSASQAGQAALQASGNQVATPTILNGTTKIDINDRNWLSNLK
ncbi:MAG: thioredoxin domain-containing protein [Mycobacteriaceae bacterium]